MLVDQNRSEDISQTECQKRNKECEQVESVKKIVQQTRFSTTDQQEKGTFKICEDGLINGEINASEVSSCETSFPRHVQLETVVRRVL